MRATKANGLLVAADGVADVLFDALKDTLRAPVIEWRCAGTPWDGEQEPITLVLHDVIAMRPREQRSLFAWMTGDGQASRVISFAASELFPLIEAGTFFGALYYRLNSVYAERYDRDDRIAQCGLPRGQSEPLGDGLARAEAAAVDGERDWLDRVRGEYLEMPGLSLTERQAQRLWGFDGALCHATLDALTRAGFLRRTVRGAYIRGDIQS